MTPPTLTVPPTTPVAQPAATATPSSPTAAPADFLAMLGQLVGAAVPTAPGAPSTPILTGTTGEATDESTATDGAESVDVAGLLALSLPVAAPQTQLAAQVANGVKETIASVIASPGARTATIAPEAKLLTDLIQGEQQQSTRPDAPTGLDAPTLPVVNEAASASKTAPMSPTDQVISRPVHAPVGSAAWADEIGSRLTLMAEHGKHTASLRLSPEHLGPLEIRIAIQDDQASVWFGAAHADTRAAIENALPRLRELFASQGLSLADAGVSHQAPREHREPPSATPNSSGSVGGVEEDSAAAVARQVRLGLIDAYA